jgi:hypothetical protein
MSADSPAGIREIPDAGTDFQWLVCSRRRVCGQCYRICVTLSRGPWPAGSLFDGFIHMCSGEPEQARFGECMQLAESAAIRGL